MGISLATGRQQDPFSQSVTFHGSLLIPDSAAPDKKKEALILNSMVLFSGRTSDKQNLYEYRLVDNSFVDAIECPMAIEYISPIGEKHFLDCLHKDDGVLICKPLNNLEYMNRVKK